MFTVDSSGSGGEQEGGGGLQGAPQQKAKVRARRRCWHRLFFSRSVLCFMSDARKRQPYYTLLKLYIVQSPCIRKRLICEFAINIDDAPTHLQQHFGHSSIIPS